MCRGRGGPPRSLVRDGGAERRRRGESGERCRGRTALRLVAGDGGDGVGVRAEQQRCGERGAGEAEPEVEAGFPLSGARRADPAGCRMEGVPSRPRAYPCPAVAVAPSSRSRVRAAAMAAGPAFVCFRCRSYAQTVAARDDATASAGRPARAARARPAAVRAPAAASASPGAIRPEGIGRWGRSTASSSRSAQSLSAIPASYRHREAPTARAVPRSGRRPIAAAPASASPGTVNSADTRSSSAQARSVCRVRGLSGAGAVPPAPDRRLGGAAARAPSSAGAPATAASSRGGLTGRPGAVRRRPAARRTARTVRPGLRPGP